MDTTFSLSSAPFSCVLIFQIHPFPPRSPSHRVAREISRLIAVDLTPGAVCRKRGPRNVIILKVRPHTGRLLRFGIFNLCAAGDAVATAHHADHPLASRSALEVSVPTTQTTAPPILHQLITSSTHLNRCPRRPPRSTQQPRARPPPPPIVSSSCLCCPQWLLACPESDWSRPSPPSPPRSTTSVGARLPSKTRCSAGRAPMSRCVYSHRPHRLIPLYLVVFGWGGNTPRWSRNGADAVLCRSSTLASLHACSRTSRTSRSA